MADSSCEITEEEVKRSVEAQLEGQEFFIENFKIVPASSEPLGFMGDHVRIRCVVNVNGVQRVLIFFAKKMPTQVKAHREYAEATKAFYKEIELYKSLFRDMESAISDDRVHEVKWRPDCYYTRDWDLVICEDLAPLGYFMLPERALFPPEYVEVTLETLAKMHAGSIILEEKLKSGLCKTRSRHYNPDMKSCTIRDLYPDLIFESECTDKVGHPGYAFWEAGIKGQEAVLDELEIYTSDQKAKIKEKFGDTIRQIYRMLEPSDKYRNVMIHADLWGNNVMFHYDSKGIIREAITVDFQMTRYAPPAQDVLLFIYAVQNKLLRREHEEEYLNSYYSCLDKQLAAEGLHIETLLPRQEYDDSCRYYKRYAILNQIIYTQLTITPPEICKKLIPSSAEYQRIMYEDRSDILVQSFHADSVCRARATEAIEEIVETFGLL